MPRIVDGNVWRLRARRRGRGDHDPARHGPIRSESMTDETFHLTPLDVRRFDFRTALRGYEREHVDQFREQVATELERLGRLNTELDTKARTFGEQLKSFRE